MIREPMSIAGTSPTEAARPPRKAGLWERVVRRPQSLWVRRAIFQIHLWTGIAAGLYILVVSVTGSVLVFRVELSRAFTPPPIIVKVSGSPFSEAALTDIVRRAYPGYQVTQVFISEKDPTRPAEVWFERRGSKKQQLFDPYTGADLGPAITLGFRTVSWMLDLHDNLLAGQTGRLVNGIGGLFLTLLCLTGTVIWWPGIKTWHRGLLLRWSVNWKRLTWDLHNVVGFWTFALVFIWAFTGVYLVFQQAFAAVVDYLQPYPPNEEIFAPRLGDRIFTWFGRLHFGRYGGMPMKIAWAIFGLAPPILFVTGAIMWWNRVLRHGVRQSNEGIQPMSSPGLFLN
jgi:uncharacterized iron-regulated membrane protein